MTAAGAHWRQTLYLPLLPASRLRAVRAAVWALALLGLFLSALPRTHPWLAPLLLLAALPLRRRPAAVLLDGEGRWWLLHRDGCLEAAVLRPGACAHPWLTAFCLRGARGGLPVAFFPGDLPSRDLRRLRVRLLLDPALRRRGRLAAAVSRALDYTRRRMRQASHSLRSGVRATRRSSSR
ncbi:MAG: hypothetical protein OXU43_08240 [Gammaproteobacteria bacterium]|nr:hypothetical protein [Gammaproteobacteria bacterium]